MSDYPNGYSLIPVEHQPEFDDVPPDGNYNEALQTTGGNQHPAQIQLANADNDNRTPQELCDQAQAMCVASARMSSAAGEAQEIREKCADKYNLCTAKATRGVFSKGGDFMFFPDGGTVIFRPEYQLYVPPSNKRS